MAKAYSEDCRRKVMQAIEMDGLKKCEASQLFNISRNTINLWCQGKAATGDLLPKPRQAQTTSSKITDWDKFRAFVKTHQDKTQAELAQLWGGVSQRTLSRALQKIDHTRKKNVWLHSARRSAAERVPHRSWRLESAASGLCR